MKINDKSLAQGGRVCGWLVGGLIIKRIMRCDPSCKLILARIQAKYKFQDGPIVAKFPVCLYNSDSEAHAKYFL